MRSTHSMSRPVQGTLYSLTYRLSIARLRVRFPSTSTLVIFSHLIVFRSNFEATNAGMSEEIDERVKTWNELLRGQIAEFSTSSQEATTFLFSSHQVLSDVMDNPDKYDLAEDDPETGGGEIWEDDLHLTVEVHEILADCLLRALLAQH